jgi:hypothetical protein
MAGDRSRDSLHDAIIGQCLKIIGTAVLALAVCVWLSSFFLHTLSLEFLFIFAALGLSSAFLLFKGKQYLARSKSAEFLLDSGPLVVLLRPFETDTKVLRRAKRNSYSIFGPNKILDLFTGKYFDEEDLAEAVRPIGRLVTVGDPGQALPLPGAARFHETDQTWKDRVIDLMRRARVVILVPSTSEALLWEITTAFQRLKPQQLLILGLGTDTQGHEALSQIFKKTTGQEFPDRRYLGHSESTGVIFDVGWVPRILRVRAPFWRFMLGARGAVDLRYGLEPVFRANGIEWHPPPVKEEVWGIAVWLITLGAVLGPSGPPVFVLPIVAGGLAIYLRHQFLLRQ